MSLTWSSFNAGGRVPHFFSACAFGKAGFVIPGRRAGFLLVTIMRPGRLKSALPDVLTLTGCYCILTMDTAVS